VQKDGRRNNMSMKKVILKEILEDEHYSDSVKDGLIELKNNGGTISIVRLVELGEEFLKEQLDGFLFENIKQQEK
jgi:hypothetical protein